MDLPDRSVNVAAQGASDEHAADIDGGFSWLDLATTDVEDAAGVQRRWMPTEYDQVDGGAFAGRFQQLGFQDTLVAAERQNRTVLKRLHFPPDYCSVCFVRSVSGQARCDLDAISQGTVAYLAANNEYEVLLPPSEIAYFRIRQDRFLQAADTLGYDLAGDGGQALMFDSIGSSDLNDMLETLMSLRHSPDSSQLEALNHEYLEKVVLERTLRILSNSTARSSQMPSGSAYRITQAAQALLESSPDEPLTVMTLCQGLGVSRASLQRSFLQIHGVAPLAYLRMRRLNCARRALKAVRGTNATVTAIAMQWGFFHFARFAQDYLHQFGELPSTTLGRSGRTKSAAGRSRVQR
ncbi:helix-turn-helix domain-containing protein [Paraburkholderia sediminicola]|uniref:helix-turn-helix domain-containing protein n=1 Tax=Paraburkholderia sediminicola TaxID=458836 RepID=UPI0038BC75F2